MFHLHSALVVWSETDVFNLLLCLHVSRHKYSPPSYGPSSGRPQLTVGLAYRQRHGLALSRPESKFALCLLWSTGTARKQSLNALALCRTCAGTNSRLQLQSTTEHQKLWKSYIRKVHGNMHMQADKNDRYKNILILILNILLLKAINTPFIH